MADKLVEHTENRTSRSTITFLAQSCSRAKQSQSRMIMVRGSSKRYLMYYLGPCPKYNSKQSS